VNVVTVSPKFQVVIPRDVREALGISPGQKLRAIALNGRVELVPVKPARALRGFLRGIDTTVRREKDRL
jgi:AbrB family looped-hinge helix DNA binding protein